MIHRASRTMSQSVLYGSTHGVNITASKKLTQENCVSQLSVAEDAAEQLDRSAQCKLISVFVVCLVFMVGEIVGGVLAGSLAVTTDAAHLLTDLFGFAISLAAIHLAVRPASSTFNYGWGRAGVVGAFLSVLSIWVVTGVLVYLAIERVINQDFEIEAFIMLVTATLGIFANIVIALILQGCSISHSHLGHGHSHGGQGHSHKDKSEHTHKDHNHKGHGPSHAIPLQNLDIEKAAGGHKIPLVPKEDKTPRENLNVRAAFIHALGDIVQSVGVFISAIIIYFKPEWKLADPICTFIFSIIVIFTTVPILRDTMLILMEGKPKGTSLESIRLALENIPGVRSVHNLCVWSLTTEKTALSAHVLTDGSVHHQVVLQKAHSLLQHEFSISPCTLQLEEEVSLDVLSRQVYTEGGTGEPALE